MPLLLAQASAVHIENPTQGLELLVFAAGFVVGALLFRMLVGRW